MVRNRGDMDLRQSSKTMRRKVDSRPVLDDGRAPPRHVQVQRRIIAKSVQQGKGREPWHRAFASHVPQWRIVGALAGLKQRLAGKPGLSAREPKAWIGRLLAAVGSLSLTSDRALATVGLAAAAGSAGFAGYMILNTGHSAGPDGKISSVASSSPMSLSRQQQSRTGRSALFDHEATGAIHPRRVPAEPTLVHSASQPHSGRDRVIDNYVLRFVDDDAALVQGPAGVYAVIPGTRLPDAGRILSIEHRDGAWLVVTENGVIKGPRF